MFQDRETYQPAMLPTGEAAKRLHVSPQTVRDWTDSGKLTAQLTRGGHRQYREDDIAHLALAERGITSYWVDDVLVQMNGDMEVSLIGKELKPYVASEPEEVALDRYRKFHNGLEVTPRTLAITQQAQVLKPKTVETVHEEESGDLVVQAYLSVFSLDRQECTALLEQHIPAAVEWLKKQARPVYGVAKWVTIDGAEVRSAY